MLWVYEFGVLTSHTPWGIIRGEFKGDSGMRYCMGDANALKVRINRIIGQLNGVQKMLGEDVPCEDILTQISAANGALHKIGLMILEGHLRHCVREGIENGNADTTIENFADALEHFASMT